MIAHLTSLRSLECTVFAFRREDQWEELADALSSVRSRPKEIVIRMQLIIRKPYKGVWILKRLLGEMRAQLLDTALEQKAFGDLGALVFVAFGCPSWDLYPHSLMDLLRVLREKLPKTHSRYNVTASAELE